MTIKRQQLDAAVKAGIIEQSQSEALYDFLRDDHKAGPRFDFTHVKR